MITSTNVTHKASQCPQHPDVRIVRKDVTKNSDTQLTEFFCAVGECNQPLG